MSEHTAARLTVIWGIVLKVNTKESETLSSEKASVILLRGEGDYAAWGMRENITRVIRFSVDF